MDIVFSGSDCLVHDLLDGRCKDGIGTHWFGSFLSSASGSVPRCGQNSILSYNEAYTSITRTLSTSIPDSFSPQRIVLGELWPRAIVLDKYGIMWLYRVKNNPFVKILIYELTSHTLSNYPTRRLLRAKSIKGVVIEMGVSWHCKMSCLNELELQC